MSTVSKSIADAIIAGRYSRDNPTRIVEYTNAWGGLAYGVTFNNQSLDTYLNESPYIRNPKIYWDKNSQKEI